MTNDQAPMTKEKPRWSLVLGPWSFKLLREIDLVMNTNQPTRWLPLSILVGALVIWTTLLALGAYLEWGADQPRHDIRKPLWMLGTLTVFLAVWGLALWLRARRPAEKNELMRSSSKQTPPDE